MLTRTRALTTAAALFTMLSAACDEPGLAGFAAEDVAFRDGAGQSGPVFNTPKIFTSEVAAIDTVGQTLAGVTLLDVELVVGGVYKPIDVDSLDVDHGTLTALIAGGAYEGLAFVNSRWTFDVNGTVLQAKLATVETAGAVGLYDPAFTSQQRLLDPERLVYTFTYTDALKNVIATCKSDAIGGARMVIYGDILVDHKRGNITARENSVYFGCLSGAVGKASLWGYAPDSPSLTSVPLPVFETGVRTVRADYCGDGKPNTNVGNAVTLRDRWLNPVHPPFPGFTTEAVWGAGGGALCVNRIRATGATLVAPHACADGTTIPLCGADGAVENDWANGIGHIWTKIP